jgi:hypothetical protein
LLILKQHECAEHHKGAYVAKKIVLLGIALAVGLAAYVAIAVYRESQNTPEAAMSAFMQDLAAGDADKTYERFGDDYAAQYPEADWVSYVASLGALSSHKLESSQSIDDRFNTYPKDSNPQRFVYTAQVKGRQYRVSAVILKQDTSWRIDDFQGSYR